MFYYVTVSIAGFSIVGGVMGGRPPILRFFFENPLIKTDAPQWGDPLLKNEAPPSEKQPSPY